MNELSWEEWIKLGEAMKKAYDLLLEKLVESKSKTGARARKLEKAIKSMVIIQDILDDLVFQAFPDKPTDVLVKVFYGPQHPEGEN